MELRLAGRCERQRLRLLYRPALKVVRLTLPRRVYSDDHLRAVADGIVRLYQRRHEIRGLAFVYQPPTLRFFQGRFEPVEQAAVAVPV